MAKKPVMIFKRFENMIIVNIVTKKKVKKWPN